jgi:DAK2 domain fusion protein YloV
MVINMHKRTTESDIEVLKDRLMQIGDQVICMGDLKLVKVHVHTNEPNRALGYALELGELYNMKIENMLEQVRAIQKANSSSEEDLKQYGMVSIAAGEGLASLFKDLLVDYVVEGGQTMNPSADDIAEAVNSVNAQNVFVMPNNKNIILAAEQAKGLTNKNIIVIPTKTVPEGISACLAFNEEANVDDNTANMTESIAHVKTGSVTYAVRETHVDGFDLAVGDIIGLDKNSIIAKSGQVAVTTEELVAKLVDKNTVNITLFYGSDIKEEDASTLQALIANKYPDCEVSVISGGQPVYYYIISVE